MPQMAPINWLLLYFIFIMILIVFTFMNYFSFLYHLKTCTLKNSMSWKWQQIYWFIINTTNMLTYFFKN